MGLQIAFVRIDCAFQFPRLRGIHRNICFLQQRFTGCTMFGEPRYPNAAADH